MHAQDLDADDISPGLQLSAMLADILEEASTLHSLSLANNHLDDMAVANIMRALAANGDVQLTNLNLAGNSVLAPVGDGWCGSPATHVHAGQCRVLHIQGGYTCSNITLACQ